MNTHYSTAVSSHRPTKELGGDVLPTAISSESLHNLVRSFNLGSFLGWQLGCTFLVASNWVAAGAPCVGAWCMAWIREPQEPYPQPPASSSPQSSLQLLNQLAEQCKKDALMRRTRRMSTATVLVAASHDVDRLRRRLPPLALSARVSGGHREEVVFAAAVRSPLTHQRAAAPMRLSHRTTAKSNCYNNRR